MLTKNNWLGVEFRYIRIQINTSSLLNDIIQHVMENKTAESTEDQLTTEPFLVDTIIEILSKEVEGIKAFLDRKDLLENN